MCLFLLISNSTDQRVLVLLLIIIYIGCFCHKILLIMWGKIPTEVISLSVLFSKNNLYIYFIIFQLNLSWNELTTLPENTFDWEKLEKIDLQGNPWHCSCSMQWLLDKVVGKMYHSNQELLQNLR